ncbi:MAG: hypothetical protein M3273_02695, partial [Actinomycetota bacterium]|nr:hypothetical protein [Actinomycetota bacterium]
MNVSSRSGKYRTRRWVCAAAAVVAVVATVITASSTHERARFRGATFDGHDHVHAFDRGWDLPDGVEPDLRAGETVVHRAGGTVVNAPARALPTA